MIRIQKKPNQIIKLGKQCNNVLIVGERKNQTENLRRTLTEIEYAKEREDRLKKDLEVNMYIEIDKLVITNLLVNVCTLWITLIFFRFLCRDYVMCMISLSKR